MMDTEEESDETKVFRRDDRVSSKEDESSEETKGGGGGGGIFDVHQDGNLVFSKHEAGRFPEEDEVLQQLAS